MKLIPEVRKRLKKPPQIIQNAVRLLQKRCLESDVEVDEQFLVYFLYMVPLNVDREESNHQERLNQLLEDSTKLLATVKMPLINTLKMQQTFVESCQDLQVIEMRNRKFLLRKTKNLIKEIVSITDPMTKDEKSDLLRKIALDIVIQNGLGSPRSSKTLNETEVAVKSVMSNSEFAVFVKLRRPDKIRTLEDLRQVVCGIRLFNRDAGHGGEGILNLPTIVERSFESTQLLLEFEAGKMRRTLVKIKSILYSILRLDGDSPIPKDPENTVDLVAYLKDFTVLAHQKNSFVDCMLKNMNGAKDQIFDTVLRFKDGLRLIHEKVQFRTAIPTDEIYPRFRTLGFLWKELQSYVFFLTEINLLNERLQKYEEVLDNVDELFNIYGGNFDSSVSADHLIEVKILNANTEFKKYEKTPNHEEVEIKYHGFCPWALASGFLLNGNPKLGSIKFNNEVYLFCGKNAMQRFVNSPDLILKLIEELIEGKPELILTLDLTQQLFQRHVLEQEEVFMRTFVSTSERAVQTEVRCREPRVDCNIIELRKRAQQLVNLPNYRTHSTQTVGSWPKSESETQTLEVRHKSIQTPIDKGVQIGL